MSRPRPVPALADPFDLAVGARLRLLRRIRGLTLLELARHVGVSLQQVQKYENGTNRMTASALALAADGLGVALADLLGETPAAAALPVTTLALLGEPAALDLLRAYVRIEDPRVRAALVALATALPIPPPDADGASV